MKITVSGVAAAYDAEGKEIKGVRKLKKIGGVAYDESSCSEYFAEPLSDVGITGGEVRVVYDAESKSLRVVTEYASPRKLKKRELEALVEETAGQWSDGIGEGCFDDYERETGIHLDLYPLGVDKGIRVEQIADRGKAPKKKPKLLLHKAAERGDVDKLRKLLAKGADVEERDRHGETPLLRTTTAWGPGRLGAILLLLEHGADPNAADTKGYTLMEEACTNGRLDVVRTLLEHGVDVDARDGRLGATGAMWAACYGRREVLQFLVDAGADLSLRNTIAWGAWDTGNSILVFASPSHPDIIDYLLEHGVDPNVRNDRGLKASEAVLKLAEAARQRDDEVRAARQEKKAELLRKHEA